MPRSPLVLVLTAVLLLGFVAPTGASSGDHLWTDPDVVLAPGTGPGGAYTTLDASGELEVDVSSPGLNAGAVTVFGDVFTVTNGDDETVALWFSHDAMDEVVLSVGGRSAQDETDPLVLAPGEAASVDLTVDSSASVSGDLVLSSFTVHAENASTLASGDETAVGPSGDATVEAPANASTEDGGVFLPAPSGDDEVVFLDGSSGTVVITSLDPATATSLDDGVDGTVRPAIDATTAAGSTDDGVAVRPADAYDGVVTVGEPFVLRADRSTFASVEAVQPDGRVARLVDVSVPADRRDEPAYLRLAVDRARLGGTDPEAARIGRLTDEGWQLLATRVVEADAERVVLEARTPGFSRFAVFPNPSVRYAWRLPDGSTATAQVVRTTLHETGPHEAQLVVTDALGRSSPMAYHLLGNDRPSVRLEAPSTIGVDEPVSLSAAVDNEVGAVEVRWAFADGGAAEGETVERSFGPGEHVVRVTVVDEYGASSSDSTTLVVGRSARASQAALEMVRLGLAVEERLVGAAVAVLLLLVAVRQWAEAPRRRRTRGRRVR